VSNVNITELVQLHKASQGAFGNFNCRNSLKDGLEQLLGQEQPDLPVPMRSQNGVINGGYFRKQSQT
jgi:hypothetical protein